MKTLHIHIGTPKTGTTAIQNFCRENMQILNEKGYCYPIFSFSYKMTDNVRNGHFLIGKLKDEIGEEGHNATKRYMEGIQQINELFHTYDNIILSDEAIWRSMDTDNKDLWEKLVQEAQKGEFKIHVIVYLRRQDKFLYSFWNQQIKRGKNGSIYDTFENYLEKINKKARLLYYTKLERVAVSIGKENITVRRFDKGSFEGGSIYADFLLSIGLPMTEEFHITNEVRNIGLYGNTHEIKRILNVLPQMKDLKTQRFIISSLEEFSEISKEEYPCEMLSQEEIANLLNFYGSENQKVATEYLHEPELFDNTISDLPKWKKENPYMIDDIIRFVGVTSMRLFKENEELKQRVNKLEKETMQFKYDVKHPFLTMCRHIKRRAGIGKKSRYLN